MNAFEQREKVSSADEGKQNSDSTQTTVMYFGIAVGTGLGLAIGAVMDDIGLGFCLDSCVGMCIGLAVGANRVKPDSGKKPPNRRS